LYDIPRLLDDMLKLEGDEATNSAKKLYELCDVAHKQNRIPMVCSGKFDVLTPLTKCLLHANDEKLHFVCLCLNNLSVPEENKRIMALERGLSQRLIDNLCKVISLGKKEAYLCIICLMNMSYLEASVKSICQFSPKERGQKAIAPLENPNSLLRTLQDLIAHSARGTADFRWGFGLLASLSRNAENANLIGLTAIPQVAVENLRVATTPPSGWKVNSLEDFSLFLILHVAQVCSDALLSAGALEIVASIMTSGEGGLQGLKATMVCAFLEAPWSSFPSYGVPASAFVSELMGKTLEREGKKGVYSPSMFRLQTATKAYGDLARAAVKADTHGTVDSFTKIVALPTGVACLFQIVADVALTGGDDDSQSSDCVADERSAEHAVSAITALLPTLLKAEVPPRHSRLTETACNHLKQMLLSYSEKSTSITAKARAKEAAEQVSEASESALPILEASYDLWVQYTS
jgi:hypothetical protein